MRGGRTNERTRAVDLVVVAGRRRNKCTRRSDPPSPHPPSSIPRDAPLRRSLRSALSSLPRAAHRCGGGTLCEVRSPSRARLRSRSSFVPSRGRITTPGVSAPRSTSDDPSPPLSRRSLRAGGGGGGGRRDDDPGLVPRAHGANEAQHGGRGRLPPRTKTRPGQGASRLVSRRAGPNTTTARPRSRRERCSLRTFPGALCVALVQ